MVAPVPREVEALSPDSHKALNTARRLRQQQKEGRYIPEPKPDKKFSLTFVVSGQAFAAEFPENQPLRAAVQDVLAKTKNTGQPIENWIVTLDGKELDFSKKLSELGLKDGVRLLLNPRTGRGGG